MPDFEAHLRALVDVDSPSTSPEAVTVAHDVLEDIGTTLLGKSPIRHRDAHSLEWRFGESDDARRVLLLGHLDTVWPIGTSQRRPFEIAGGRATGPGVFDMKAGVVVALHTLASLDPGTPVSLLVTGDEEIGSSASRRLIERTARECQACLVLEGAGPAGSVKSARSGWSFYTLVFHGRAAHAGLEPDSGRNVLPVLARAIGEIDALHIDSATLNPTTARAGTTTNTIPDHAELTVDVRCASAAQQRQVDDEMRRVAERLTGDVQVELHGGANRPPMEATGGEHLLARLRTVERRLALPPSEDVRVGGISDANLTAAIGVATLDGLGAIGGGPHAEHEWVDLDATQARIPTIAALIDELVRSPLHSDGRDDQ